MVRFPRYEMAHIYNFKDLLDGFMETYPDVKPHKDSMVELFDLEFGHQNIIRYYFKEIELDDDSIYTILYKKFNSYITLLYQNDDDDYILIER